MDNLRAVIKNIFCYISPEDILSEHTRYDDLSEDTFVKLGNGYIDRYSNDELQNMYYFLENELDWNRCRLQDKPYDPQAAEWRFNVFAILIIFDTAVLLEEDGEPKCQYQQLLRWRDMTTALEEDLFITSFLAYRDGLAARNRENFFWRPVIGHNNRALNALLEKGVAENHFHLKGSAPHFHLSWISIMNNVDNQSFQDILDDYDANRLQKNLSYNPQFSCKSLGHRWRQAALIRIFLFSILQDTYLRLPSYQLLAEDLLKLCSDSEKTEVERILQENRADSICINSIQERLLEEGMDAAALEKLIIRARQRCSEIHVLRLLSDETELRDASGLIQDNIDSFKEDDNSSNLDYTICKSFLHRNETDGTNELLSGERWFLYSVFREIYYQESTDNYNVKSTKLWPYFNWFYLYLVIKAELRKELVQANKTVGFTNFLLYQNRKEDFIDQTPYEAAYLKMAVRDTIYNQHIVSLEARIAPKNDPCGLSDAIRKYDTYITDGMTDENEIQQLKEKYFYVIHFVKEPENWIRRKLLSSAHELNQLTRQMRYENERRIQQERNIAQYRQYAKRNEVKTQALAIASLRESGAPEAARLKGIDAASPEIWCRPEVFAQAFRFLRNHTLSDEEQRYVSIQCPRLKVTYHAGEDFLDIIDGLRAIDEAILFLNMHCGDRLGHALALGVDIDDWYQGKSNRVLINKLGYLDNITWLYAKIRKYHIESCVAATAYIEKRFEEYFHEVYGQHINPEKINRLGLGENNFIFDINVYYDAWKLRGDYPAYYQSGSFQLPDALDKWEKYAVNKEYPSDYKTRYNSSAAFLNYMYHYDPQVKRTGDQMIEVKVIPAIRDAVKKVAANMQRDISSLGICIETNPSSNFLIGTFRRYDKHPIARWYNLGLTDNPEDLQQCPQMQVSINTDDQGVFYTYIENEYAYLSLAMEKCVDSYGQKLYNRARIMQWLDNIRQMGIDQSFRAADNTH